MHVSLDLYICKSVYLYIHIHIYICRSGSRDRDKLWPFNIYPSDWSRAKKKALDMMQVLTVHTPYKDEDTLYI